MMEDLPNEKFTKTYDDFNYDMPCNDNAYQSGK